MKNAVPSLRAQGLLEKNKTNDKEHNITGKTNNIDRQNLNSSSFVDSRQEQEKQEQQQKGFKEESPGSKEQQPKKYNRLRILFTEPDATESSSDNEAERMTTKPKAFEKIVHGSFVLPSSPVSFEDQKKPKEIKKQKALQGTSAVRHDVGQNKHGEIKKQTALQKTEATSGEDDQKKREEINKQSALHETERNKAAAIALPPAATRTGRRAPRGRPNSLRTLNMSRPPHVGFNGGGLNKNSKKSNKNKNKNKKNNTNCCCDLPLRFVKISGPVPTDFESLKKDESILLYFFHDFPDC